MIVEGRQRRRLPGGWCLRTSFLCVANVVVSTRDGCELGMKRLICLVYFA